MLNNRGRNSEHLSKNPRFFHVTSSRADGLPRAESNGTGVRTSPWYVPKAHSIQHQGSGLEWIPELCELQRERLLSSARRWRQRLRLNHVLRCMSDAVFIVAQDAIVQVG
jgi:hypothetical protein